MEFQVIPDIFRFFPNTIEVINAIANTAEHA